MTDPVRVTRPLATGRDDVCVLAWAGQLDHSNAQRLRGDLQRFLLPEHSHLVLDLAGLSFADSTGVRIILALRREILQRDGVIALAALNDRVSRLLEITGLTQAFAVHPSTEQALSALPQPHQSV
ncbi:STAS domain-containing protein [Nonomuraea africana]|uniref:STAS domain-containing protein n=1 Tax=Nonomuraea africana TaxID=46171 RepID=UPI00340E9B79